MIRFITGAARRNPGRMLIVLLLAVPVLAIVGSGVSDRLSVGGFVDPGAESTEVADSLADDFETGSYGFVLLLEPKDGFVYNDHNVAEGERIVADLEAEDGVLEVASFYNVTLSGLAQSPLRDLTGKRAIVGVVLDGDEDEQRETAEHLHETYVVDNDVFAIGATGVIEISRVAAETAEKDLQFAELLAAPFTLAGLLVVFRGWRAASLPLAVAVFAVLGSFVALTLVASITDVSIFARTLVTALGLGLAIDYSLLLVARFREERSHGRSVESAMSRTMQTAGRTVVFSAATVGSSLLGLLVFPVVYLRSFAFAGVAVVTMAALASLLVVPPVLVRWGEKMGSAASADETFWGRQAERVMRRPLAWLVPVGLLLVFLAVPFFGLEPGRTDDRALPEDSAARQTTATIREHFNWSEVNTIHALAPDVDADDAETIRAFTQEALQIPGVIRVNSTQGYWRFEQPPNPPNELTEHFFPVDGREDAGTWFNILYWYEPEDPRVDELLDTLRADETVAGEVLVGGPNATINDTVEAVTDGLPFALFIVGVVTYVLLFFMTGSLLVPLKAVILNLLSLSATFGALVWIFQEGNLGGLSGVTATGELDVFTPILMFCVAFGLSMDYEVFLLARIKEEYDLTADNHHAVRVGIGRTGPIVTAAALLLAIVFLAISTSGVSIVRMFGFGLALAVLTDAFLVRGTITPALMKLAGRANWWAPRAVRRFHLRYGIWENDPVVRGPVPPVTNMEAT